MSRRMLLSLISRTKRKMLVLALVSAAVAMLQGCGSSYPAGINPSQGATLQNIQITPNVLLLPLAGSRQLFATGTYSDGTSQDISAQVTWSAGSPPNATSNIVVSSSGVVTSMSLGFSVVSAALGPVVGTLQMYANTNGFSSNNTGILVVPFGTGEIDAAYQASTQSLVQGAYAVQEVNLDADHFTTILPVPSSVIASIPMPSGFIPSATAVSENSMEVAVISYSSSTIVVIDASNNPSLDPLSNTVIGTFTAPVTGSVTFKQIGRTCMICAAVVNPLNNQLLLSTADGYYEMDLNPATLGTFTQLKSSQLLLAPSFTLNPLATPPYVLSPDPASGQMQILTLDLTANTITVAPNVPLGLSAPSAAAIDLATNFASVADAEANDQTLLDVNQISNPVVSSFSGLGVCKGATSGFNMVSVGVGYNGNVTSVPHTLFFSQAPGNCMGLEIWPSARGTGVFPNQLPYGFGTIPPTPTGPFLNGTDPNAIATFTSVVDKNNYGLLIDSTQNWMVKMNLPALASNGLQSANFLPQGTDVSSFFATGGIIDFVYLPTPATVVTLSQVNINFGNVAVGTTSGQSNITLTNVGANNLNISGIALQGANASDFMETDTCTSILASLSKCTITVDFTPSAKGARSATLSITDDGGASPQTVPLSGTGT